MRLFGSLMLWLLTAVAAMFTYYGLAMAQLAREAWAGVAIGAFVTVGLAVAAWMVSFGGSERPDRGPRPEDALDLRDEGAGPPR